MHICNVTYIQGCIMFSSRHLLYSEGSYRIKKHNALLWINNLDTGVHYALEEKQRVCCVRIAGASSQCCCNLRFCL